jgi:NAD(P)H-flavin reductase
LVYDLAKRKNIEEIFIINGNRNKKEILYQDFFEKIILKNKKKIILKNVLSRPKNLKYVHKGYIQENISEYNFDNSDIFICGREKHCENLISEIKKKNPENVKFLVEAFH